MFYVFAQDFHNFGKFVKRSGLILDLEIRYLSDPTMLEGLERPRVLKINGYQFHPKLKEIELMLKSRNAVVTDAYC